MGVWIILGILLGLIIWILLAPLELQIDSRKNIFFARWKTIGGARFHIKEGCPLIRMQIFFFKKEINLFAPRTRHKGKKQAKPLPKRAGRKKRRMKFSFRRLKLLLRSFEVKDFRLNLDTDDYILNAYLFPIFFFLDKGKRKLNINFQGDFEIRLFVQNRLIRLIGAFLR